MEPEERDQGEEQPSFIPFVEGESAETCPHYAAGTLAEFEDQANAAKDEIFEQQFFCGC